MKGDSIPTADQTKVRVLVAYNHPVARHGIMANVKPQRARGRPHRGNQGSRPSTLGKAQLSSSELLSAVNRSNVQSANMNTTCEETLARTPTYAVAPDRFAPLEIAVTSQHFREATLPKSAIAESARESEVIPIGSPRGDTFQLYLREIGLVKLLTPEQEIELAERIQRGDPEAREQMIKANLRLVVKIARDYEGLGLALLDLVSEGNIGLMKGVERFQPTKGAKLSTYVAWWIKQSIKRALANQSKTIRLPVHVTQKVAHIRRAAMKLRETLDREATDEELADDLELNPRCVRQYREASRSPICLDSPVSSDDPTPISETVADENAAAPFDELVKDNDLSMLRDVLATLDARESKILTMRYGLDDGRPKTLEQIGENFGITRERIRQIQQEALEKMRERIEKRDPLYRRPAIPHSNTSASLK
jgi:RNA polymerase primary sigma factor